VTTTHYRDQLDRLLEGFFEDLRQRSDAEILDKESATTVNARVAKRLDRASAAAGSMRLAAARQRMSRVTIGTKSPWLAVSEQQAREYILRVSRDSRYTLAARSLSEMSASEILLLYRQLKQLETDQTPNTES
jgi:hypothetical protein